MGYKFLCIAIVMLIITGCATPNTAAKLNGESLESAETRDTSSTELENTPVRSFDPGSIIPGEQQAFSFLSGSGKKILFWLYLPQTYDNEQSWPLILSLHGYVGNQPNLNIVREQTPPEYLGAEVELPFIVVSPQATEGPQNWSQYFEPLDELIMYLSESLSIDSEAQFLTGLSMGTSAVWEWAMASPERFAGIAVVAGTASMDALTEEVCQLRDLPVWIAHSEIDELPIASHRAAADFLEGCGSTSVHFKVFSDLEHMETIESTFAGPELYDWMLIQEQ